MSLDPQRFPRASTYLANLPNEIGSYPDCQVRVDGRTNLCRDFGELAETPGIPLPVRTFLEGKVTETWMPEVISVTALAMARDAILKTDDELREWSLRDCMEVFDSPVNKMLMKVLSPTLVVMGAAKRWNHWRLGSTIVASPVQPKATRLETVINLSYPDHLYDEVSLIQFGQVYTAAVIASNGKNPELSLEALSVASARYVVSWDK